jgi:hypothetical protein
VKYTKRPPLAFKKVQSPKNTGLKVSHESSFMNSRESSVFKKDTASSLETTFMEMGM